MDELQRVEVRDLELRECRGQRLVLLFAEEGGDGLVDRGERALLLGVRKSRDDQQDGQATHTLILREDREQLVTVGIADGAPRGARRFGAQQCDGSVFQRFVQGA